MKRICLLLATALTIPALIGYDAHAIADAQTCVVPKKTMGPLILIPHEFLRSSLKDTHTITNFKALKSDDFSDGYFVAGEIVNISTKRSLGIGVWFAPDWYAMPGPASKYSTLLSVKIGRTTWSDSGNGYKIKKDVSKKSHGFSEILKCFK